MHLIQILLPLRDNAGRPYATRLFDEVNATLVETFGGVTAYSRSPARGRWVHATGEERDDVIVIEVMAKSLDHAWWGAFRARLEAEMDQSEIVVRTFVVDRL